MLALLVLGCGGGGEETFSAERGEELVLTLEDVGAPFKQSAREAQQRADLTPPRDDPSRFGREGGWRARFQRTASLDTLGPVVIESRADLFGSVAGAERDLALYERALDMLVAGARGRRIPAPPLADGAHAVVYDEGFPPNSVRRYAVAWRHGRVTASVTVDGLEERIRFADAIDLARKQERRITEAMPG